MNQPPDWMKRLLERAAFVMLSQWPAPLAQVEFRFGDESKGEGRAYRARLEFAGLVLKVHDGRTGEFVCQSLDGKPFEIDPAEFDAFAGSTDE
jgi:hypothetical protein